jgi:asparagine synthase (glutamine-hydrolysing)
MGGIAGWVAVPRRAVEDGILDRVLGGMLSAIAHRFDAQAELHAVAEHSGREQAVLGATLHDAGSGISIALDGAIGNAPELRAFLAKRGHAFGQGGDAEVLLRAYQHWDKEAVKQLRGAFALALWDARKERLLLARDRFGAKPLFLHERDGALHFASEPKALLASPAVPARPDAEALRECMLRGYVPGPRTLFEGIRKLPPASYALWQLGRLHEARYWTAPDGDATPVRHSAFGGEREAVDSFLATLEDAVKAESGAGLLLSAGLDSAVLGALLAKQGGTFRTFALGFEGEKASELPLAAQAAKHFGAEHHEVLAAPRELPTLLSTLVRQRDAPLARASDLAVHALAMEAARSVPRVLTGEGCDEVLGGYRRYLMRSLTAPMRSAIQGQGPQGQTGSPLRRALYEDQTGPLPDDLLERADRIGASAGVELRMPYLDHRLAERVSAEPDAIRVRGLSTKWILRRAAERLLPVELRKGPKRGFRPPLAEWLRGPLREPLEAHLRDGDSLVRERYGAAAVDRLLEEHLNSKKNHAKPLWTLLNIEIWRRTSLRA